MNKSAVGVKPEHYDVIKKPIITEKATMVSDSNAVVFQVAMDATKPMIKEAVEAVFGVKVKAVNTTITSGHRPCRDRDSLQPGNVDQYVLPCGWCRAGAPVQPVAPVVASANPAVIDCAAAGDCEEKIERVGVEGWRATEPAGRVDGWKGPGPAAIG